MGQKELAVMLVERGFVLLVFLGVCFIGIEAEHNDTNSTISRNYWTRLSSACPNLCSKQGICTTKPHYSPNGICNCFPGFYGVDCSLRTCPAGYAWVDLPSATDTAHGFYTECSNMGDCNRATGKCSCRAGFGGPACDVMLCPTGGLSKRHYDEAVALPCSGNGRCVTLKYANEYIDYRNFMTNINYDAWDANMIQGCACDEGWEGSACELKSCPKGDDPETSGVDEIQILDCTCTTCSGGMYLTFRGEQTRVIPYDASNILIRERLLELTTLEDVSVRIAYGTEMCSSGGSATKIIFNIPQGDVPTLEVETYGALAGTIAMRSGESWSLVDPQHESQDGTREYAECSNRGNCDYVRGECECLPGFTSSDGAGSSGSRNDCGYRYTSNLLVTTTDASYSSFENGTRLYYDIDGNIITSTTNCPFVQNVGVCSGHGECQLADSTCTCHDGYTGPACDRRTCGTTTMWFGELGSTSTHVNTAECGGIGECDRTTGVCKNCGTGSGAFSGSSCEYLTCPKNENKEGCNGTGYCRSLREITALQWTEKKEVATYTYTSNWDADMIYGCACMRAPSIDNRYSFDYDQTIEIHPFMQNMSAEHTDASSLFFRGPYAMAATDFSGWACTSARCPNGDNPATRDNHNEIQRLNCKADSGSFTISFRGNTTEAINYDDTHDVVEYKLEEIFTISHVTVRLFVNQNNEGTVGTTICSSAGTTYAFIEFLTETGNLPLITMTDVSLALTSDTPSLAAREWVTGTKEDIECSGQGICNENTGQCNCSEGYGSSNGTVTGPGNRGDCTYRDTWMVL